MAYDVSSSFVAESRKKRPNVIRNFTIAGSDYSDRVMRWPSFQRKWDDIRPKTLTVKLANGDKGMNFLREDKTLMEGNCVFSQGFSYPWEISLASYDNKSLDVSPEDIFPRGLTFKPDGTRLYTVGNNNDTIYQYTLSTAWDISTASYDSKSFDVSSEDTSPEDLVIKTDGTKIYVVGGSSNEVYQYTLSTAWDISTASYDSKSFDTSSEDVVIDSIYIGLDGTKMYAAGDINDTIYQYTLSTAWDISTASYDSKSFDVSSEDTSPLAIHIRPNGTRLYVLGSSSDSIHQYTLSTAWDISTASYDSKSFDVSSEETAPLGLYISPDGVHAYIIGLVQSDVFQYSIKESIDLFSGKMRELRYEKEDCNLTVVDKFQQLSERQIGTDDVPVSYTGSNYLPSDIAWWAVTSYGGYSNITSISNPDIDFDAFNDWAAIFSGDAVFVQAEFDGQKCTEVLRKIARQTHSAIFIKEDMLSFHRFGIADANVSSLGPDQIRNLKLSFDTDDITNRQFVAGDYSVDSDFHQFTVFDASTASVNSFGVKENTLKDNNFWYVNSGSAINLAQRLILANADPDDSINVETGLAGLPRLIGETIFIEDEFHSITESYRILEHKINMDSGKIDFRIDRTQLTNAFTLDTTSLGSLTEVLT